jgi:hypothetical protein
MPTDNRTIHFRRIAALAIALIVPIMSTAALPAYADNESAAAIEPPYRPVAHGAPQASLSAPHATSGASASTQQDDCARDIHRPGISDR